MLGTLRGLRRFSCPLDNEVYQVGLLRVLANDTLKFSSVIASTESAQKPVHSKASPHTAAPERAHGKRGERHKPRQHRRSHQEDKAEFEVGRRGSEESGCSGRYLNTWPVIISNMARTVVAADIVHFLPPLGLDVQDVRPEFDAEMRLVQFWVALHNTKHQELALALDGHSLGTRKVNVGVGSPEQMESALNRRFASSSKGRYVMVTGLTMKATTDDVMRLFQKFDMLPASVSMLMTGLGKKHRRTQLTLNPNGQQVAVIRFETYEEANRALRTYGFSFVRNDLIKIRIII